MRLIDIVAILLIFLGLCNCSLGQEQNNFRTFQSSSDSLEVKLIKKENIHKSQFFSPNSSYPQDIAIYDTILYFLNYEDNSIIQFDTRKNTFSTNPTVNKILNILSHKYSAVTQIWVNKSSVYIIFLKGVLRLSRIDETIKSKWETNLNITYFQSLDDDTCILYFPNKVCIYTGNGSLLKSYSIQESIYQAPHSFFNKTLYLSNPDFIETITIQKDSILRNRMTLDYSGRKEPNYLASITQDHMILYPYEKRDQLFFYDPISMKYLNRTKILSNVFAPTKAQLMEEEGIPKFKIVPVSNKLYYAITVDDNILKIYKLVTD